MARAKKYRPALAEMGRWKWLAMALVSIPVLLTGPYAMNSSGFPNGLDETSREVLLGDCPLRFDLTVEDDKISMIASLSGACSARLSEPVARLVASDGSEIASASFKGSPSALRASIGLPDGPFDPSSKLVAQADMAQHGRVQVCLATLTGRAIAALKC